MFYNGLIGVLSCEIYVGWVTFEREMYTEFIEARNRLDEETDLAIFLRRQMWPASVQFCAPTNEKSQSTECQEWFLLPK